MCGYETAFPLHRWRERETRFQSGYSFPFALPSCTLLAQTPKVNLLCLIDSFLLGVVSKSLAPLHPLQSNLQTLRTGISPSQFLPFQQESYLRLSPGTSSLLSS